MLKHNFKLDEDFAPARRHRVTAGGGFSLLRDPAILVEVILLIFLAVGGIYLNRTTGQELQTVQTEIQQEVADSARLEGQKRMASDLREQEQQIAAEIQVVRRLDSGRFAYVHILDEIADIVPQGVWIASVGTLRENPTNNDITVRVTGYAPTNEILSAFARALEAAPFARNVYIQGSTTEKVGAFDAIAFEITVESEQPDEAYLDTQILLPDGTVRTRPGRSAPIQGWGGAPPQSPTTGRPHSDIIIRGTPAPRRPAPTP